MNKGDWVRLTRRAAQGLSTHYGRRKTCVPQVDWFTRVGSVVSFNSRGEVAVQWDGRRTVERYRHDALAPLLPQPSLISSPSISSTPAPPYRP